MQQHIYTDTRHKYCHNRTKQQTKQYMQHEPHNNQTTHTNSSYDSMDNKTYYKNVMQTSHIHQMHNPQHIIKYKSQTQHQQKQHISRTRNTTHISNNTHKPKSITNTHRTISTHTTTTFQFKCFIYNKTHITQT